MTNLTLRSLAPACVVAIALVLFMGCTTVYHDAVRESARPRSEQLAARVATAQQSHTNMQKHLARAVDQASTLQTKSPANVELALHTFLVTVNQAELEAWNASRDMLAVADFIEQRRIALNEAREMKDVVCALHTDQEATAAPFQDMLEAFAASEELVAELIAKLHDHAESIRQAIQIDSHAKGVLASDAVLFQWDRVNSHAKMVDQSMQAMISAARSSTSR
jgi:hypothetical protein